MVNIFFTGTDKDETVIYCFNAGVCILQAVKQLAHLDTNWYPNKKESLQSVLVNLSKKSAELYDATLDKSALKAIIVPHAGYAYSGAVATGVYRLCDKNNIKKVIILAPDRSISFEGVALPLFDSYQTPEIE